MSKQKIDPIAKFEAKLEKVSKKVFPIKICKGYYAEKIDRKIVREFINRSFEKVFREKNNDSLYFSSAGFSAARNNDIQMTAFQYRRAHHEDILIFDKNDRPVGWMTGESEDYMSFYMRNTGILPAHQGKGIYSSLLLQFAGYISKLGYERVTSHHKGDNVRILIPKLKTGFVIAGMENHEVFGTLIKMVLHLKNDRKTFFKNKYC